MTVTARSTFVPGVRAADLWAWHKRPGAFQRLVPPWQDVEVLSFQDRFEAGERAELALRVGPTRWRWDAVLTEVTPGRGFVDVAEGGPFVSWRHVHRFVDEIGGARLEDEITWTLPAGPLGQAVGGRYARREVERLLAFRHRRTVEDLALHARWADVPRKTIGITGASGMVGTALTHLLTTGGHTVVPFVRRGSTEGAIPWDPAKGLLDPGALSALDAVVHLAGAPIAGGRWTAARKALIRDSRVDGTRLLANALAACDDPPEVLVSASAVGIYGHRDAPVDEHSPRGSGFLADVGAAWEAAAEPARAAGLRVVHPRIGLVLSARDGFLAEQLPVFRAGGGGPLGGGRQAIPWVALDDLVRILVHAVFDPAYTGAVNAVGPASVPQRTFAKTLGSVLGVPAVLPTPTLAIRALYGEMGQALILEGTPVEPTRLRALGYNWVRPTLTEALSWELGRFDPHARGPHAP